MIAISEIEQVFKDIFEKDEGLVKSVETLYERPNNDDSFLKLIISLHGISVVDMNIIHTKFIFKVDNNKTKILKNSFLYLFDINCDFHEVDFDSVYDMEKKIHDIMETNNFGEDMQILSDFIEAPAMFLNYYLKRSNVTDYSIFEVRYNPKFKNTPCKNMTFDFDININNNYDINLSIQKIEEIDEEGKEHIHYDFTFKFMNDIEKVQNDSLNNVHFFIGTNLSRILDSKLKNK